GERPREHVSPSAGAERNDEPEGPGGIVLGRRGRAHCERNDGEERRDEKSRHDVPPFSLFLLRIGRRPSRRKAGGNVSRGRIDLLARGLTGRRRCAGRRESHCSVIPRCDNRTCGRRGSARPGACNTETWWYAPLLPFEFERTSNSPRSAQARRPVR